MMPGEIYSPAVRRRAHEGYILNADAAFKMTSATCFGCDSIGT